MPNLLSRLRGLRPALTRRAFWLWAALITLLRCAVTHFQLAYMWAGGAPLDDELMFRAANAITSGQWLGEYDYLTLSKSMFFAVWLALLNKLHLPYLLGGALLWCAAALLAAFALRPLWRKSPAGAPSLPNSSTVQPVAASVFSALPICNPSKSVILISFIAIGISPFQSGRILFIL